MPSVNLVVVDDHQLFRETFRFLLRRQPDLRVAGEASGAAEAYRVIADVRPDVVVLDLLLPGTDGVGVVREIRRLHPACRVLMLSMVDDPSRVADALEAGALGFATKNEDSELVGAAIRAVSQGRPYLSTQLDRRDIERCRASGARGSQGLALLTSRERDVFALTVEGLTANQIGARLFISPRTVETHRGRILRKLGARTAADLVRIAARIGALGERPN
ncbi:MAG TPA: response regulator transcription factor [Myxococcales bacterium]|jgi:DNA-binding NarL/FixJ family response regulator|nr:response regulator transcription factor [Myxococcales bacterium]